jgi:hypothetical protein
MKQQSKFSIFSFLMLSFSLLFFSQCNKDDDGTTVKGRVNVEMTDAPIDNAEVQGAFVTITDVKLDGESINLANKTTIDILAYQNGDTRSLGISEIEAGTYSSVTLVLDYASDQNGNTPGCYVLATDGTKYDLNAAGSANQEITFSTDQVQVEENSETNVVVDFDLRKAIKSKNDNNEKYSFVSNTELSAALRAVVKTESGTVAGTCNDANDYGDKVVVYAYKKGTYSASEMEAQGSGEVEFSNAVTSASVQADGSFSLHFLEEGEYETHFIVYEDDDSDGTLEIKGTLQTSIVGSIFDLLSLNVEANTTLSVNINATGLLPL